VGLGATIPIFQGGIVASRVDQARAAAHRARAGSRAAREAADLEVRQAHGALAQSLAVLEQQDEAVRLATEAVEAAERRAGEGGGSLLQLQQAQLELVAAEAQRTRARSAAARASDALRLAVKGEL
jgi:outer membrane protein